MAAKKSTVVEVPAIEIQTLELTLIGDSPLIVHRWSDKARDMMRAAQSGKARQKKEPKVPAHDFVESLYWLGEKPPLSSDPDAAFDEAGRAVQGARFGFPVVGFKACAVSGCRVADGIPMTLARNAFHIAGELAEIEGPPPVMREDMVRVGRGTADIRYRGMFEEWRVTLRLALNKRAMTPEQVVNLFNLGGFGVGVGEWRPEKDGSYGRFHVG